MTPDKNTVPWIAKGHLNLSHFQATNVCTCGKRILKKLIQFLLISDFEFWKNIAKDWGHSMHKCWRNINSGKRLFSSTHIFRCLIYSLIFFPATITNAIFHAMCSIHMIQMEFFPFSSSFQMRRTLFSEINLNFYEFGTRTQTTDAQFMRLYNVQC